MKYLKFIAIRISKAIKKEGEDEKSSNSAQDISLNIREVVWASNRIHLSESTPRYIIIRCLGTAIKLSRETWPLLIMDTTIWISLSLSSEIMEARGSKMAKERGHWPCFNPREAPEQENISRRLRENIIEAVTGTRISKTTQKSNKMKAHHNCYPGSSARCMCTGVCLQRCSPSCLEKVSWKLHNPFHDHRAAAVTTECHHPYWL